jgi:glycosyl transferase family 9 (putative heptosyltransferase)
VVRAGALGDVLLLRRATFALRRGGYEVTLLAPAASGAALLGEGPGEAQRLVDWERADVAALLGPGPLPDRLQRQLDGHALALAVTRDDSLVRHLGSVVPRVLALDPHPAPGTHAARWLAGPLAEVGLEITVEPAACRPSAAEERAAGDWRRRLPSSFLALHPGSGSPRKNWPAERFRQLRDRLRPADPWLLVGGPADAATVAELRGARGCVVADGLPVRVLGAVLGGAGLFVGNDSGVSHLAAAFGAPTVALFGPTDAAVWAPDGARVRVVQSPTGEMSAITVDDVVAAAAALC